MISHGKGPDGSSPDGGTLQQPANLHFLCACGTVSLGEYPQGRMTQGKSPRQQETRPFRMLMVQLRINGRYSRGRSSREQAKLPFLVRLWNNSTGGKTYGLEAPENRQTCRISYAYGNVYMEDSHRAEHPGNRQTCRFRTL